MKIDVDYIKDMVSRHIKDRDLKYIYDLKDKYIICLFPKNMKDDDIPMDPYYAVDKKTGMLSGWNPTMDLAGFKKVMRKPIYRG